jgi:hypothetical protein
MRRYWKALHPDQAAFGVDYMLFLMWHESRGDPSAHNQTACSDPWHQASGLMQQKPVYWLWRIAEAVDDLRLAGLRERWMDRDGLFLALPVLNDEENYEPVGIFHPQANIAASAWLFGEQGWPAWSPSQSFPPEEYEPPKPGKGVWWVDELDGYRRLGKGGVSV